MEQRQSLTTDENGAQDKDEQINYKKSNIFQSFLKRHPRSNETIDPLHYPLEQVTDAEYGISSSYAPTNVLVDEHPEGSRNVDTGVDENESRRQKRRKFIAGTSTIIIFLISIIAVIVGNDTAHPKSLEIMCSLANIATISGRKECIDACAAVECCFTSGDDSCYAESEEKCRQVSYFVTVYA